MILSTNESNPNALKIIIGAKLGNKNINLNIVKTSDESLGRLPALKLPCGTILFSSRAALEYLFANTIKDDNCSVNKWLEWDSTQLQPALVSYGSSGSLDNSHKPRIWALLKDLNAALKNTKYLINNDDLSSADISIWTSVWSTIILTPVGKEITKDFPNVDRWIVDIEQLPIVKKSIDEFKIERGIKAISSIQAVTWFPLNSYTGGRKTNATTSSVTTMDNPVIVSELEIDNIKRNWIESSIKEIPTAQYPVLPKKGETNILVTSALPYVNNVPHLGNIIGCVLSADIFARYCRQRGYNTLYISGTDEYGTATEAKALEENLSPQEICDKYFNIHNDIYRWFNIGFDYFGRTTTPEQTEIVQDLFLRIKSQGYIITESVDQLLCENCDRFLADRFVEGICPGCKYEDARGDQCDGCGHLVNATELIKPRCKVCNNTPIIKASTQFFIDLPKLEQNLRDWASSVESGWSSVARAVTKPWLRDGLKQRCITRDLKWGIPVPLDGYRDKVFYVWFDAPLGYVSITKRYTKDYEKWWKPDDNTNVNLYQFMAKDNVPFHAIMFPATLIAANEKHILVKNIMATEYLNYEDTKFSKSRGTGVFGTDARDTGIPADVWRFYLAYIRPESQDSNFNWVDLATKNNSELLNNFGNFVNRSLMFAGNNFNSIVPDMYLRDEDINVLALVQRELNDYLSSLEQAKLRDGLRHLLAISKHGNQYMQSQQPWVKVKGNNDDKKIAGTVIGICCNLSCLLASLLGPFMPNTSRQLRTQLGLDPSLYGFIPEKITILLPAGHKLGKASPLFTKIEDSKIEELRKKYGGKQDNGTTNKPTKAPKIDNINDLEAAILKQGLLVRELKAKQDKTIWQPQVQILLQLKKQLADLTESSTKTVNSSTIGDKKNTQNGVVDTAALEDKIAKQALLVRELKAKEEKSVWQPQVEILLKLKKELTEAGGVIATNPTDKKSKKKK